MAKYQTPMTMIREVRSADAAYLSPRGLRLLWQSRAQNQERAVWFSVFRGPSSEVIMYDLIGAVLLCAAGWLQRLHAKQLDPASLCVICRAPVSPPFLLLDSKINKTDGGSRAIDHNDKVSHDSRAGSHDFTTIIPRTIFGAVFGGWGGAGTTRIPPCQTIVSILCPPHEGVGGLGEAARDKGRLHTKYVLSRRPLCGAVMLAGATGVLRQQGRGPIAALICRRALWMRQEEEMRMLEEERTQQEEQQQEHKELLALPAAEELRKGCINDADKKTGAEWYIIVDVGC